MQLSDNSTRYGIVSRVLHWGMALLFLWQFIGMGLRLLLGRTPVSSFFVGSHASIGTCLMLLVLIRLYWSHREHGQRPPYANGITGLLARVGHWLLYTLMVVVPLLALMRQYGAGRKLEVFGLTLMPGRENRIEWLMAPGNLLHGNLAWLLLAVVMGHAAAALWHHFGQRDDTLRRMAGPMR